MFKVKEEQNSSEKEPSYMGALNDTSTQHKCEGFQLAGQEENLECGLKEILYELIQAPRPTVDDMLIAGSDMAEFNKPKWVLIFIEDSWNEEPCIDVHQVGDEREVEVLRNFNWLPSELITDDGVLPKRGAKEMKIEKQSSKFIKPLVSTPPEFRHYKLGFIDEFAVPSNVGVVLFFPTKYDHNPNFFSRLENSLEKTLTRLYPLAGRYVEEIHSIDCNDQGSEFIHAKVNIKLQDILGSKEDVLFIDEFIPSSLGAAYHLDNSLPATQVTTFECGGVALGVSATHKIIDSSTLCTFINEWAVMNREENETEFNGPGFNSSSLFPARDLSSIPVLPISDCTIKNYIRKKFSFSESFISNMKAKAMANRKESNFRLSKVQLVSAVIWKALNSVDQAIHKSTSLETIKELADILSDSVNKTITNFSKVDHNSEEGQTIVLNTLLPMTNVGELINSILLSSWCKFPFYEADFGYGQPTLVSPGTSPYKNATQLMDDAGGNGIKAYLFLEAVDVPLFKATLLSVDLNEPKDSSKTDKAAQNGHTPKSLTLEIHHGGWFTPTPSRSYIGGQVSSVNVVDIDEFCLHDLKDMVVKLGYGIEDLMYCHFLIPSLGLDYNLHSLNVDADVLEMSKYVKDYKIILVYVKHGSSIFVIPKKGVSIALNNHLRKGPLEIDSSPDVNKTLTHMCHLNLTKEWEQPSSYVEAPIIVECAEDPFEELDDLLGKYIHIEKQITRNEITVQVSSVNVVDIDEFCLHDLKDMVVKLGYGIEDLMYCHFLIPSLGLDYNMHSLNVDANVLEMSKYVKDYKIILVYVKHGSSNVDTSMFDSSPDVNKTLTPTCHLNLTKE
ncbi:transferase, chloramphenicol acetyltransferase-like domain protein [Tanacetum coccineum]